MGKKWKRILRLRRNATAAPSEVAEPEPVVSEKKETKKVSKTSTTKTKKASSKK